MKKLDAQAAVWGPAQNCRHSLWALDHFQEWVADQHPDVVHVNFGIHDAVIQVDGEHQILLNQYRLCLRRFIAKVKGLGDAKMFGRPQRHYTPPERVRRCTSGRNGPQRGSTITTLRPWRLSTPGDTGE